MNRLKKEFKENNKKYIRKTIFFPENLCQIIEMRSRYCYFGHDHCAYAYSQKEIIIVIPYEKQFLLNNCYQ